MSVSFHRTNMPWIEEDPEPGYEVYGPIMEPGGPYVNMSNTNAAFVLDLLGLAVGGDFSDYCCGSIDPEDLKGRCLLALGLNGHDHGVPGRELVPGDVDPLFGPIREGGPTVYDCGRAEGYADERLALLLDVAEDAARHGDKVVWS